MMSKAVTLINIQKKTTCLNIIGVVLKTLRSCKVPRIYETCYCTLFYYAQFINMSRLNKPIDIILERLQASI